MEPQHLDTPHAVAWDEHRQLVEAQRVARIGTYEWDPASDRLKASAQHYRNFGVEPAEEPGSGAGLAEMIHPDDRRAFDWLINGLDEGAIASRSEFRVHRPDGTVATLDGYGIVVHADDGTPRIFGTTRDVTREREMEAALRDSEERQRALTNSAPVGIFELDLQGRSVFANQRCAELVGLPEREAQTLAYFDYIHPDDRDRVYAEWRLALEEHREFELEYRFVRADGEVVWVIGRALQRRDKHGNPVSFIGTLGDITAIKQADQERAVAEERFRRAFEDSATGMALIDAQGERPGRFMDANAALVRMSGYSPSELPQMTYWDMVHPDELDHMRWEVIRLVKGDVESFQCEQRMVAKGGVIRWIEASVSLVRDTHGNALHAVVQAQDVTERKRVEDELQHMADHDPLTGVFNRRRFASELERELSIASRYETGGAVLVIDIDNFKAVNDSRGHAAGDSLLRSVATLISDRLRESDLVGRLGGDEFGVILPHADEARATLVAEDLRSVVAAAARIEGEHAEATVSVGVATFAGEQGARAGERTVAGADAAMYAAKQAGRNQVRLERPAHDDAEPAENGHARASSAAPGTTAH